MCLQCTHFLRLPKEFAIILVKLMHVQIQDFVIVTSCHFMGGGQLEMIL